MERNMMKKAKTKKIYFKKKYLLIATFLKVWLILIWFLYAKKAR
jgi:uncharacterized membrane protein